MYVVSFHTNLIPNSSPDLCTKINSKNRIVTKSVEIIPYLGAEQLLETQALQSKY